MAGYDIKKLVDAGLSHFWSESYGQLYQTLGRLVEQGLAVRGEDSGTGGRRRVAYAITEQGRSEFRAWLKKDFEAPSVRNEFLLKFFLASRGEVAEVRQLVLGYQTQQGERLAEYRASEALLRGAVEGGPWPDELRHALGRVALEDGAEESAARGRSTQQALILLLTLRHGVHSAEGRLAWCEEALSALEALAVETARGEKV